MPIPRSHMAAASAVLTLVFACAEDDSPQLRDLDSATLPGTSGYGDAGQRPAPGSSADAGSGSFGGLQGGAQDAAAREAGVQGTDAGASMGGGNASEGGTPHTGDGGSSSSDASSSVGDATAGSMTDGGAGVPSPSPGCGKTPSLTAKTQMVPAGFGTGGRYSLQSAGQNRSFIIRLPDNYDNRRPYWLIFGFHWNGGLADDVDSGGTSKYEFSYYGLQKQSKNGAIFVAPQGIGNGWPNSGGRDLAFTDDMVKLITEDLCVDTTHIISTGFSYGAGMSYAIACARAKVFDAVVLYAGMQLSGCEGGTDPIAYMQLAGLTDTTTRIANARPMRDKFVRNNGCEPQNPPEPPQGSLTHICTSYSGCSSGYPVRWCAHGAGHTPAPVDGSSSLVDGINTWTPKEVWSWLTSL